MDIWCCRYWVGKESNETQEEDLNFSGVKKGSSSSIGRVRAMSSSCKIGIAVVLLSKVHLLITCVNILCLTKEMGLQTLCYACYFADLDTLPVDATEGEGMLNQSMAIKCYGNIVQG